MGIKKKLMAMALVAAIAVGSAFSVSAATSPANPEWNTKTETDSNKQDHIEKTVVTKVTSASKAVVQSVASKKGAKAYTSVVFEKARNAKNVPVQITQVGNGKKGVFASKGQYIKKVTIRSKAAKGVTIATKAFNKSKVKTINVTNNVKKLTIKKNAFKGTKQSSVTLKLTKKTKLKLAKDSLKGLKKLTVKGSVSKAQKNALKKAAKAAGVKITFKK